MRALPFGLQASCVWRKQVVEMPKKVLLNGCVVLGWDGDEAAVGTSYSVQRLF